MRYEKGHKDATHRRIVETASKRFRNDGIEGVSVANVMREVGLTHGGFYLHFDSKDALVREAIVDAFTRTREALAAAARRSGGIETIIRIYLSLGHRDQREQGCPAAALSAEIGRMSRRARVVFDRELELQFEMIGSFLPATLGAVERKARATAIFGALVGTLCLARAVSDKAESQRILEVGSQTALSLAARDSADA